MYWTSAGARKAYTWLRREHAKPDYEVTLENMTDLEKHCRSYHSQKHTFDPTYMSDDFREFRIKQDKNGRWRITQYKQKLRAKELQGLFTSFNEAEKRLVSWIKRYNKGHARYPGCPKPRPTNSIVHFLKDWSPKPAP